MVPAAFSNFFIASASAGAALVGLLFVATSITPEHTITADAPVERRAMAASAFTALLNAFFISLGALIPTNVGWIALTMSSVGLLNSLTLGWTLLKKQRGWLNLLRRTFLIVVNLIIYGFELNYSVLLIQAPNSLDLSGVGFWRSKQVRKQEGKER